MDEGLFLAILSAFLTVPATVLGGLILYFIQRSLDAKRVTVSDRRKAQLANEYKIVQIYHDDPTKFHSYLLGVIVRLSFIPTVISLFGSMIFALSDVYSATFLINPPPNSGGYVVQGLLIFVGQLVEIIGTFAILVIVVPALRIMSRVQHFDRFEADMARLGVPKPESVVA